jgi:hypothetical protein
MSYLHLFCFGFAYYWDSINTTNKLLIAKDKDMYKTNKLLIVKDKDMYKTNKLLIVKDKDMHKSIKQISYLSLMTKICIKV